MDPVVDVSTEQNDAEMEAAFAASFDAPKVDVPAAEPTGEQKADAPAEAAPKAEDKKVEENTPAPAAPAPSAPELTNDQKFLNAAIEALEQRMSQRVDKVSGNYGEVKRALDEMKKAAATPKSAAAFDASEESDYLATEFPELAQGVNAKIAQALEKVQGGMTADQFEEAYAARREAEERALMNERIAVLEEDHPDRFDIQKTPEWKLWHDALPAYQQKSLVQSADPLYVSGMLHKFKTFRDKAALEAKKNQTRIEDAVTPKGVRPKGPSTVSDDEAAEAAFSAQFK